MFKSHKLISPRCYQFILIIFLIFSSSACALFRTAVLPYQEAKLPDSQIITDIQYWSSSEADPIKNRLDLFLPRGNNWPVLIFVHGGEWISGDKSLKVMGADIYGNIGRFFAARGIGVAVINYRLMPEVNWKSQVMDVARAISWVRQHIKNYHGNPNAIFLAGHSSGAQISAKAVLDEKILQSLGLTPQVLRGVILISGAGYDLTDEETYELAKKEHLFEKLFHTGSIPLSLRKKLSPILDVKPSTSSFLVLYSEKEEKELQDESKKLYERLKKVGAKSQLMEIADEGHTTVILTVSNPSKSTSAAILVFIKTLVDPK